VRTVSPLTASLVGAVADELSYAMDRAVEKATGMRGEASAALTALLNTPGLSVKELARFLGMASPSAVELITRLESRGLVIRREGPDARTRSLALTASGRRAAAGVLRARDDVLQRRLGQLSARQRTHLRDVAVSLLSTAHQHDVDLDHLCRRCDESQCTDLVCPIGHSPRQQPVG